MIVERVVHEADIEPETWADARGEVAFRTIFGESLGAPDFTVGVAQLDVGGWLGPHRHEPAEIYHVLSGEGTLTIDGTDRAISAGTVAYIPSTCEHAFHQGGAQPLRLFYVFAVGSYAEIQYRFSDLCWAT